MGGPVKLFSLILYRNLYFTTLQHCFGRLESELVEQCCVSLRETNDACTRPSISLSLASIACSHPSPHSARPGLSRLTSPQCHIYCPIALSSAPFICVLRARVRGQWCVCEPCNNRCSLICSPPPSSLVPRLRHGPVSPGLPIQGAEDSPL